MLKKTPLKTLLVAAVLSVSNNVAAVEMVPSPPRIEARGFVLIDANSGEVIAGQNERQKMAPASLTKVMTAYIIGHYLSEGRLKMTDPVTISKTAWSQNFPGSSKMFIKPGDDVTVADLTRGVMIQSGNDACVAIAEHIAGSEGAFVSLMNGWAEKLGMQDSNFINAHGLDGEGIATTPLDMATLLRRMILDVPDIYKIYSEKSFRWAGIEQENRNKLLSDRSLNVDGGKTGFTSDAGYSLAASAIDGDMRLVSVVMGTASPDARIEETRKLMNYGFRFFGSDKVASQGQSLLEARVWMGEQDSVPVTVNEDIYATVRRDDLGKLTREIELQPGLKAPLNAGQVIGVARWSNGDEVVREAELVAGKPVAEGGLLSQILDRVLMFFDGLVTKLMSAVGLNS